MELAKQAKEEGQKVYVETCPHYLLLDESYVENMARMQNATLPSGRKRRWKGCGNMCWTVRWILSAAITVRFSFRRRKKATMIFL
ncbi:MAG: hypothetical protein ACLUOI_32735 [Eisenbergiella sp.]